MGSAATTRWKPGSWAELALNQAPRKLSSTSATTLLCDPSELFHHFVAFYLISYHLCFLSAARTSPSLECVFSESHLGLCARFSFPHSFACQAVVSRLPVSCHHRQCPSMQLNGCCLPSGAPYCPVCRLWTCTQGNVVLSHSALGHHPFCRHWCLMFPEVLWAETLWDYFSDADWRAVVANWWRVFDEESTHNCVFSSLEWTLAQSKAQLVIWPYVFEQTLVQVSDENLPGGSVAERRMIWLHPTHPPQSEANQPPQYSWYPASLGLLGCRVLP